MYVRPVASSSCSCHWSIRVRNARSERRQERNGRSNLPRGLPTLLEEWRRWWRRTRPLRVLRNLRRASLGTGARWRSLRRWKGPSRAGHRRGAGWTKAGRPAPIARRPLLRWSSQQRPRSSSKSRTSLHRRNVSPSTAPSIFDRRLTPPPDRWTNRLSMGQPTSSRHREAQPRCAVSTERATVHQHAAIASSCALVNALR